MILHAYTIHDVKSLTYSPPFFAINDQVAKRMLEDIANDIGTSIGRHPADFRLYRIGGFDDQSGLLLQQPHLDHIADAISLVRDQPTPALFARANGSGEQQRADNRNGTQP